MPLMRQELSNAASNEELYPIIDEIRRQRDHVSLPNAYACVLSRHLFLFSQEEIIQLKLNDVDFHGILVIVR